MVPPLPNLGRWATRCFFPDTLSAGLGFGTEYWRDYRELPGFEDLTALGRRDLDPRYELTANLLPDVIDAAGAVEYTVAKIPAAVAEAESVLPEVGERIGPEPELGYHLTHPAIAAAYVEFGNLLVWTRAVEDRVERRDRAGPRYGLLPSLRPDSALARRVQRLLRQYRRDVAEDSRHLANFTVHASRIPHPLASSARIVGDALVLRIPDRSERPVRSALALTYNDGRTVDAFARDALAGVVAFVDGVLDAFEDEAPARFRRPTTECV